MATLHIVLVEEIPDIEKIKLIDMLRARPGQDDVILTIAATVETPVLFFGQTEAHMLLELLRQILGPRAIIYLGNNHEVAVE